MTKENAHLYLPLVQALSEGKTIQAKHYSSGKWRDWGWSGNEEGRIDLEDSHPSVFRIKPEPVMVPLYIDDVPPGSVIRKTCVRHTWGIVSFVGQCGILDHEGKLAAWDTLRSDYEIKRPGQDWQPCSKPA